MNILVSLGKRIQSLREKQDLTQEQLEEKTGVHTNYISSIERGQKNVTVKTLLKIAAGLNVEVNELFLLSEKIGSERAVKKAIESLLKEADTKSLKLCLEFLRKAVG
jgi:transcriptional regulator with XRE-family HTH domain